ncbi:MAG: hypothetical protein L0H93_23220 [Nocardioides sp.]|nr:hypothetical protein [Nocardioides sp.]
MSETSWVEVVGLVVSLVTAGSIIFAAIQIVAQTRQMHREFEALYVQRYWSLMDQHSVGFRRGMKPNKTDQLVLVQYLQLCEDEIDLRRLGRVTDDTWRYWEQSIRAQAMESAYRGALRGSARSDFPSLKKLLSSPNGYDPLIWSDVKKRWKGL